MRETQRREWESVKSHGKSPTLSLPSPLTHLTRFQSPEPICWERSPTLARNETTSTPRHIPSPQRHPSLPLHSLLYSRHRCLPAHQRPGRDTVRLAWSPISPPYFSFCRKSLLSPPPTPGPPVPNVSLTEGKRRWLWWKFTHSSFTALYCSYILLVVFFLL